MAASANAAANNHQERTPGGAVGGQKLASPSRLGNGFAVNSSNNGGSIPAAAGAVNLSAQSALRHDPGISVEWTSEEQSIIEDLSSKYASDSIIVRYAKIAMQLKDKTVRDVALRCRWMTKKESGKRRQEDHSVQKSKDRRENITDFSAKSSSYLNHPNGSSYVPLMIRLDNDDGISYQAIGGLTGELLEQNAQILSQISANFSSCQIHNNINLLSKTRDNILTILNDLKEVPEVMNQMSPLPVKLNEELANSILPHTSYQRDDDRHMADVPF